MRRIHCLIAAALLAHSGGVLAARLATLQLPPINFAKVVAEDDAAADKGHPGGIRFALPFATALDPGNSGVWRNLGAGRLQWQLDLHSPDAVHLNYGFDRFSLPPSAILRIVDLRGNDLLRSFSAVDNDAHGQLWTPPAPGNEQRLILQVDAAERDQLQLRLAQVGQGYRGFGLVHPRAKSGSCNTDVACLGSSDPWNANRRSVGALSSNGSRYCTGSLLNSTANDRRMWFITATHCQVTAANAASLVVIWNFDAPSCRLPGSTESGSSAVLGPLTQFNSGAIFRAATDNPFDGPGSAGSRSDATLVELDDPAQPGFNLHWSGWDRRSSPASCSVQQPCASIHHPSGDEKRITFSETNLVVGNINQAQGVHWFVQWDSTPQPLPNMINPPSPLPPSVTEPGSSGSPLYNAERRLVGVLSGGASACGVAVGSLNDQYGQIAHAWEGLGTPATRLRDWLDPGATGLLQVNGVDASSSPFRSGFEDGEQ